MGIDLTLLPFDADIDNFISFSLTTLPVNRNSELFEEIQKLSTYPVPSNFKSRMEVSGEEPYGLTLIDPYGEPVHWALAKDLQTLEFPEPIMSFLNACKKDRKIALYWS